MGTLISLSDAELALLDGKVSDNAQKTVDAAKSRLSAVACMTDVEPKIAAFIADLITEATRVQKLTFRHTRVSTCPVCKKSAGYAKFKRSGRFHDAGDPNPKKPLTLSAVELADRFITMQNHVSQGCCSDCWKNIQPLLGGALNGVQAEIPEKVTGYPPKFKRMKNKHCTKCDWRGHEGEMRLLRAVFDGRYPGGCPNCEAENKAFQPDLIKIDKGYTLVATAADGGA